jgi:hypothetical protein
VGRRAECFVLVEREREREREREDGMDRWMNVLVD